jgi:FtsZ-interacting cell division protein ZipA
MTDSVLVAIILGVATVAAAAFSAYWTKAKEREAAWRTERLRYYEEYIQALANNVGTDATPDTNRRYAKAYNALPLIASASVMAAFEAYHDEVRVTNIKKSIERHDALLKTLVLAIRTDLKIPIGGSLEEFHAKLWVSGANDSKSI